MKFGQLIEYNKRNIFPKKFCYIVVCQGISNQANTMLSLNTNTWFETKYSTMDELKFVEDSL